MIGTVQQRVSSDEGLGMSPGPSSDLHDAAARWRAPDSPDYTATNIVVLRPREVFGAAPAVVVNAASRVAGALTDPQHARRWLALLVISVVAHASLYLPFVGSETEPMASIGEISISAELVLGANQHAGLVTDQGVDQATMQASAAPQSPNAVPDSQTLTEASEHIAEVKTKAPPTDAKPLKPTEQTTVTESKPVETKAEAKPQTALQVAQATVVQAQAAVKTLTPVQPVTEQTLAPAQVQAVANAETGELLVNAAPQLAEVTAMAAAVEEQAEVKPVQTAVAVEKPPLGVKGERNDSRAASPGAVAAGGVGRGASDADSNYRGRVSAHLTRHKRFPAEARSRGHQGTATVMFQIDGLGKVLTASLTKGTGIASLDHEATAMIARASPFPKPPNGQSMTFTVPVNFKIN